jgi:hypothetical protein
VQFAFSRKGGIKKAVAKSSLRIKIQNKKETI